MPDLVEPPTTHTTPTELVGSFEGHRRALTGYCYRMLGSLAEAEDAVQDTLVRAWRSADRLDQVDRQGPASVKPWLYRIATNVCLTMLGQRRRRALPMDLVGASSGDGGLGAPRPERTWVQPVPDGRVLPLAGRRAGNGDLDHRGGDGGADDPAERVVARESIRLAFVAALQHLPARQRAVLILRDVLRWRAAEVAELLDTTVVSVNSALRRARAAIAERRDGAGAGAAAAASSGRIDDAALQALLDRYVDAFERLDVDALVDLLHEDVTLAMPPYELWLQGHDAIRRFFLHASVVCHGHRFVPTAANGSPAFGVYRPTGPQGAHEPFALHVLEVAGDRVAAIHSFLDPDLFPLFGLPARLAPR